MKRYITPVITAVLVTIMIAIPASSNVFWDIIGGNLHFRSSGSQSSIYFGEDNYGMDVTFYGATSGKYFTVSDSLSGAGTALLYGYVQDVNAGDGNDIQLTAPQSQRLLYNRDLVEKLTYTLPSAATGLSFDFFVSDADSVLIATADGDSLLSESGSAYKTTSTVAGTIRMVAVDAVRWVMMYPTGTWTSY